MYNLKYLEAHNFMSFEDVELYLFDKCYIIKGENLDDKGQQSNGSGKTSLLEVIAITLLGQSLVDRDLKSCVNRYGVDNFFTTSLSLVNSIDEVVITRKVYSNTKSQELSITVNGEGLKEIPTKAGIKNGVDLRKGNEWILNTLLGISKEDLLNFYLISENKDYKDYKGFLASTNDKKIAVISRFSNATKIDSILEKLDKRLKVIESEERSLNLENASYQGKIEGLLLSTSDEAKKKFEEDKERQKNQLVPRLESLEKQIEELVKELEVLDTDRFQCEEFYGDLNEEELRELKEKAKQYVEINNDLETIASDLKNKLRGKITCPKCEHVFTLATTESVEEMEKDLSTVINDKTEIDSSLKQVNDRIQGQKLFDQIELDIERKSKQLESIDKSYTSLQDSISAIESQQFVAPDIEEKRIALEDTIKGNTLAIDTLQKEQQEITLWIERFEKFKYYLINKPISIICNKTNGMLKEIGCDYSISIEGFKKLKSGELRAELTPVVHIKGLESQPYPQFSKGERTRLDIACDLAIQSMINSTSKGGLNLLTNDEKISGLDSKGIEMVAKSFNKLNKTILLVSHSGTDLNYENVLTLRKENKKTVIV